MQTENDEDANLVRASSEILPTSTIPCVLYDEEINRKIRSPNAKQREIVEVILSWAKKLIKNRNCVTNENIEPLHTF